MQHFLGVFTSDLQCRACSGLIVTQQNMSIHLFLVISFPDAFCFFECSLAVWICDLPRFDHYKPLVRRPCFLHNFLSAPLYLLQTWSHEVILQGHAQHELLDRSRRNNLICSWRSVCFEPSSWLGGHFHGRAGHVACLCASRSSFGSTRPLESLWWVSAYLLSLNPIWPC